MLSNEEQERRWYYAGAGGAHIADAFDAAARLEAAEDALAETLDELTAAKARAEELQQDLEKSIAKLNSVLHN